MLRLCFFCFIVPINIAYFIIRGLRILFIDYLMKQPYPSIDSISTLWSHLFSKLHIEYHHHLFLCLSLNTCSKCQPKLYHKLANARILFEKQYWYHGWAHLSHFLEISKESDFASKLLKLFIVKDPLFYQAIWECIFPIVQ